MVDINEIEKIVEAILFASGSPVTIGNLCDVLELDKKTVENIMENMIAGYNSQNRGICLLKLGEAYQLASNKKYADYVKKSLDNRKEMFLSTAALEALAIVAYNQPVTRGYVSQVRGVDCGEVMEKLEEKELIEECGKLDAPGRPRLYKTTTEFLRVFGLSSLEQLPHLDSLGEEERQLNISEVI